MRIPGYCLIILHGLLGAYSGIKIDNIACYIRWVELILLVISLILSDVGDSFCEGIIDSMQQRRFILVQEIVDSDARIGGAGGSFS